MLLLSVALTLALTLAQEQVLMRGSEQLKVAGNNPFFYCNDPDPYTLQIAYINIGPQDPANWSPYVIVLVSWLHDIRADAAFHLC
jgi:hypothetical protein